MLIARIGVVDDGFDDFVDDRAGLAVGIVGEDREDIVTLVRTAYTRQRPDTADIAGLAPDVAFVRLFSEEIINRPIYPPYRQRIPVERPVFAFIQAG